MEQENIADLENEDLGRPLQLISVEHKPKRSSFTLFYNSIILICILYQNGPNLIFLSVVYFD